MLRVIRPVDSYIIPGTYITLCSLFDQLNNIRSLLFLLTYPPLSNYTMDERIPHSLTIIVPFFHYLSPKSVGPTLTQSFTLSAGRLRELLSYCYFYIYRCLIIYF